MNEEEKILDNETAHRKLRRMAIEIAEKNPAAEKLLLVGIRENGYVIAGKIAENLKDFFKGEIEVTALQINKKDPEEITFQTSPVAGNTIILIDDVASSGRTMLYALQPLLKNMPASIQTLALVERTHKLFPVSIDYIGTAVSTTSGENIVVSIRNNEITATIEQKH